MARDRRRFVQIRAAAVAIQVQWRMIVCRRRMERVKRAALVIQVVLVFVETHRDRRHSSYSVDETLSRVSRLEDSFQKQFRATREALPVRRDFVALKKAALWTQRRFRSLRDRRLLLAQTRRRLQSVLLIQVSN